MECCIELIRENSAVVGSSADEGGGEVACISEVNVVKGDGAKAVEAVVQSAGLALIGLSGLGDFYWAVAGGVVGADIEEDGLLVVLARVVKADEDVIAAGLEGERQMAVVMVICLDALNNFSGVG